MLIEYHFPVVKDMFLFFPCKMTLLAFSKMRIDVLPGTLFLKSYYFVLRN